MPAAQTASTAATFSRTRTFFATSPDDSYQFTAKYAGRCAWTGLEFFAGDKVWRKGAGIVSAAAVAKWRFGSTGEVAGVAGHATSGFRSDFERVTDVDAALAQCLLAGEIIIHTASGKEQRFTVRADGFIMPNWSKRSTAQIRALLTKATAYATFPA